MGNNNHINGGVDTSISFIVPDAYGWKTAHFASGNVQPYDIALPSILSL